MPTENFRSKEAYRKWTAYRHIHGIKAPHLKEVCIKGKCHKVKHHLKDKKLGNRRRVRARTSRKHAKRGQKYAD